MTSIDNFLKEYTSNRTLKSINLRSDEILSSLSNQLTTNVYVTERQANLVVKIISENIKHFSQLTEIIKNPIWAHCFIRATSCTYWSSKGRARNWWC